MKTSVHPTTIKELRGVCWAAMKRARLVSLVQKRPDLQGHVGSPADHPLQGTRRSPDFPGRRRHFPSRRKLESGRRR